ncbi:unnamed protein product [Ceratitis capitata]|uniref:(Mediterranean fruit fly) hypothetical protein n=1 Tax=Ceratitis capitata TaxID=7213 RepID=A0A811UQW7_CERCA|nr:unnamed protein product [Ceratitis capitata]
MQQYQQTSTVAITINKSKTIIPPNNQPTTNGPTVLATMFMRVDSRRNGVLPATQTHQRPNDSACAGVRDGDGSVETLNSSAGDGSDRVKRKLLECAQWMEESTIVHHCDEQNVNDCNNNNNNNNNWGAYSHRGSHDESLSLETE